MTKKLILLILALPLFLMIILFTATNTVSLAIDIPVSGVEILGDETVYLNMDTSNPRLDIQYAIYPTNASNTGVSITCNPIVIDGEEQPLAQFTYEIDKEEKTAYLTPLVAGMAEVVITTDDGNHKDRFTVVVETRRLVSIKSELPLEESVYDEELKMTKYSMVYGETFKIGNDFNPATASNLLVSYTSSDPSVAEVSQRGIVKAKANGTAIITVTSRENKHISYSFAIEIKNPENKSMVILEPNIKVTDFFGYVSLSIDEAVKNYKLKPTVVNATDVSGNQLDLANIGDIFGIDCDDEGMLKSDNGKDFLFYFAPTFYGSVTLDITIIKENGEEQTERCVISKVESSGGSGDSGEIEIDFGGDIFDIKDLQTDALYFDVLNSDVLEFEVTADNDNIIIDSIEEFGLDSFGIVYSSKKLGVTNITLTIKSKGTEEILATKTVTIVVKPSQILTSQTSNGIEGSYTIGKYNADSSFNLYYHKLGYTIGNSVPGTGFMNNVKWESSRSEVYVDNNGCIRFVEGKEINDFVTFFAVFEYNGIKVVSQSVTIRCISNGYNVRTYEELLRINMLNKTLEEQGREDETKIIVLQNNIDKDFGKIDGREITKEEGLYTEIKTTYDDTWYKNTNQLDKAYIKVLVEFRDDVYGNGYHINAENVVLKGTAYKDGRPTPGAESLFRGPLYFVSIAQNGSSLASVAGQDNICFAAYEGVTLNNITLMSMEMKQDDATGLYDLQQLHYAGTTVEVLGDNVTIEYSRIKNGRNVIRAFGDVDDPTKEIHFTVKNSVLSEGRDFIMRIGSNCFIREDVKFEGLNVVSGNLSPSIEDYLEEDYMKEYVKEGITYKSKIDYNRGNLTDEEKAKYDDMYIKTFVTLRNSVLQNPGIFAIGMDSHFAGAALADGDVFKRYVEGSDALTSWKNLAQTSYGAKLTLEGDVRMYCWKILDTVDSSSLIEVSEGFTSLGRLDLSNMKFDVKEMVLTANKEERFKNIVYRDKSDTTWVHGGVAFFGGGKNYGVIDTTNYTYHDFREYEVSFSAIGRFELTLAAGNESFYFYIHDAMTESFLPEEQNRLINIKEGWECLDKE
ncbi:MAG: Ig-like domain-containing protein [Clostridia bacterium]|nr:Ig-like domain-containing protein [Clostridia bacterium]